MEREDKIKLLRKRIEKFDGQILRLLNERAEIALEVGKIKSENQMNFYHPEQEDRVLNHLSLENPGPFPNRAIAPVFREIISACRSLQGELTVVYLGPAATFTHQSCMKHFGSSVHAIPRESVQDVFETVEKGEADYGVIPVENSTEGVVNRTLDMLIESEVRICGEIQLRISHDLLSKTGRAEKIEKIYSHPQALAQCRKWLMKNLPRIPLCETVSTANAAQQAAEDLKAGAIASPIAGQLYGLKVIASEIEDYPHNYTRFLVVGREMRDRTGKDKTSILFAISHTPGSLYRVLTPFSEKGINLTKIESRPMKNRPWEYIFFLDFEGHATDTQVLETLDELKKDLPYFKYLGSYPQYSQDK